KVNRRALPDPQLAETDARRAYDAPRSQTEQLVAGVWRMLLGVERIGILDNFIDLGGHSLLIMRAVAMLEARTGRRVNPRAFIFQTLEQVARDYEASASEARSDDATSPSPLPAPRAGLLRRLLSKLTPGASDDQA
ncbi:MAG TPA: phosphopantetheine-binding protein, partial [Vicinamibacterales bacterium]